MVQVIRKAFGDSNSGFRQGEIKLREISGKNQHDLVPGKDVEKGDSRRMTWVDMMMLGK